MDLKEIMEEAQNLPVEERARLAEVLLASLQETELGEISESWRKEIATRISAYERGEIETYPADEVFAQARDLLR
jgi:putative addiction module component (TIGR02574 family)